MLSLCEFRFSPPLWYLLIIILFLDDRQLHFDYLFPYAVLCVLFIQDLYISLFGKLSGISSEYCPPTAPLSPLLLELLIGAWGASFAHVSPFFTFLSSLNVFVLFSGWIPQYIIHCITSSLGPCLMQI